MKYLKLTAVLSLLLLSFKTGDNKPTPPTSYTITLSVQQLQALSYSLDKSNAEHTVVTELVKTINEQVEKQYKAAMDTTQAKPKH